MLARFRSGEGEVVLLSAVQGLVSEADRVRATLDAEKPAILAVGLSPESVAALSRYQKDPAADPFEDLPDHDYVYSVKLREFGDVDLPPPDLVAAIDWAKASGIPFYGVDVAEEAYEDLFTSEVSAIALFRYGRIQRKIAKKPPRANDARSFSLAWDAAIRKIKGIARVEARREQQMAAGALRLAREQACKVLLLVDAPRESGVSAAASSGSE